MVLPQLLFGDFLYWLGSLARPLPSLIIDQTVEMPNLSVLAATVTELFRLGTVR
jgi:hypothetical protein